MNIFYSDVLSLESESYYLDRNYSFILNPRDIKMKSTKKDCRELENRDENSLKQNQIGYKVFVKVEYSVIEVLIYRPPVFLPI